MKKTIILSAIALFFIVGFLANNHIMFLDECKEGYPEGISVSINPITNKVVYRGIPTDPKMALGLKIFRTELQHKLSKDFNKAAKTSHDYYTYIVPFKIEIIMFE